MAGDSASDNPAVSVVICAYNVAPYIRESVESALEQTHEDLEIVVVDDGSTDGGVDLLAEIDDPRLRVEKRPHSGHGASLNAGIGLARGRYVGLLDADDRWLPEKLERHLAFHREYPAVDMTYSLSEEIDVDGVPRGTPAAGKGRFVSFRDLLVENVVRNGSAAVTEAPPARVAAYRAVKLTGTTVRSRAMTSLLPVIWKINGAGKTSTSLSARCRPERCDVDQNVRSDIQLGKRTPAGGWRQAFSWLLCGRKQDGQVCVGCRRLQCGRHNDDL